MTCRCAQTQTLLFNFKLKLPYILLHLVHLRGEIKLHLILNRLRDILDTIPDGLQSILEKHRSIYPHRW